jgi:hypothetical protein
MENNPNLNETQKTENTVPNIMTCQLLDASNRLPVAFAYIIITELNLELSSDDDGFFQIPIPADFKPSQIEVLLMPTYYEYKTLQINIAFAQTLEILMKTVFGLSNFPTITAKDETQNKMHFRSWLKSKIFTRPNFDFQMAHSWFIF